MPLNQNDPYYRAEYTPDSVKTLGNRLCVRYGLPPENFGSKGNTTHEYGFHRSRAWILNSPDSQYGGNDYSIQGVNRTQGSQDDICAGDFTPTNSWGSAANRAQMKLVTQRLYDAARAGDPRMAALYEVAGTINGTSVITFAAQGGGLKSPFDSSHLDHVHLSFWRGKARNDHAGIYDIITGATSAVQQRREVRAMFFGNVQGTDEVVLTDGIQGRWVSAQEMPHIVALSNEGTIGPLTYAAGVRQLAYQSLAGHIVGPRPARLGHDEETSAILAAVAALADHPGTTEAQIQEIISAIIAAPNNGFTDAERSDLVKAAKTAAREGTATL